MPYPNINAERSRRGMTVEEMARHLGVTRKTVYNWMAHGHIPQSQLEAMSSLFNCSMNKITGFSVLTTGEGERVTLSYSVLDADGNIVSTNNRKNYVVLDEDVLTAIAAIRTDAAAHLEG